jgi:hypothetical protein
MLQKSPVLTPSLENLSYILRHREWWPDGFHWNFRHPDTCGLGLCRQLWGIWPSDLSDGLKDQSEDSAYLRIFINASGKGTWFRRFVWPLMHSQVTPEMVADQIDQYLASCHG